MKSRTLQLASAILLAAAAAFGQAGAPPAAEPSRPEASLLDAYGRLGHCDWTARLDNLATQLMDSPNVKGYVVSYNAPGRHSFASGQVKATRYYLSEVRGIDVTRLVLVEAGTREDLKEGQTELWLVPEGAEPPVAPPAIDRYAQNFSGKFDSFTDNPNVYQEVYEMGTPASVISRTEFAAKLKQQPESVGYIVVRSPKGGVPGAWRRFARRDEQLLKEAGIEATRLKSLDGGAGEESQVEIEFWVLPATAPPPAVAAAKREEKFSATAKLHTFDQGYDGGGEETERWMIENLAEFLREHPRATALLVSREPTPYEQPDWALEEAASQAAATPDPAADEEPTEPTEPEVTMRELAERWKSQLIGRHGIHAGRIVVAEGRPVKWHGGRINLWVIPEKGKRPDPSAPDEDEAEREEFYGVAPESDAPTAAPAPPR